MSQNVNLVFKKKKGKKKANTLNTKDIPKNNTEHHDAPSLSKTDNDDDNDDGWTENSPAKKPVVITNGKTVTDLASMDSFADEDMDPNSKQDKNEAKKSFHWARSNKSKKMEKKLQAAAEKAAQPTTGRFMSNRMRAKLEGEVLDANSTEQFPSLGGNDKTRKPMEKPKPPPMQTSNMWEKFNDDDEDEPESESNAETVNEPPTPPQPPAPVPPSAPVAPVPKPVAVEPPSAEPKPVSVEPPSAEPKPVSVEPPSAEPKPVPVEPPSVPTSAAPVPTPAEPESPQVAATSEPPPTEEVPQKATSSEGVSKPSLEDKFGKKKKKKKKLPAGAL